MYAYVYAFVHNSPMTLPIDAAKKTLCKCGVWKSALQIRGQKNKNKREKQKKKKREKHRENKKEKGKITPFYPLIHVSTHTHSATTATVPFLSRGVSPLSYMMMRVVPLSILSAKENVHRRRGAKKKKKNGGEKIKKKEKAIALIRQVQTAIYYYSGGRDATENETAYYIKIVCTHPPTPDGARQLFIAL